MESTTIHCINEALEMVRRLNALADEVDAGADDGYAVLCGVMRDCAYKIKRHAELERERHAGNAGWRAIR